MAFPIPPYTDGQLHTEGTTNYVYNATVKAWNKVVASGAASTTVLGVDSLVGGGAIGNTALTVNLDGDLASPGNDMAYSTDDNGVKGWFPIPGIISSSNANPYPYVWRTYTASVSPSPIGTPRGSWLKSNFGGTSWAGTPSIITVTASHVDLGSSGLSLANGYRWLVWYWMKLGDSTNGAQNSVGAEFGIVNHTSGTVYVSNVSDGDGIWDNTVIVDGTSWTAPNLVSLRHMPTSPIAAAYSYYASYAAYPIS